MLKDGGKEGLGMALGREGKGWPSNSAGVKCGLFILEFSQ